MSEQITTISGQLLDKKSKAVVTDISITLKFTQPDPNAHSKLEVMRAIIPGVRVDISDKAYFLKVNDAAPIEVFINVLDFPNKKETRYKVAFQSQPNDVYDWYHSLK